LSLYYFFVLNNPRWAIPIRTGEFFKSVGLTIEHADPIWIYKTVFVVSSFLLGMLIPLFWCRYLCPTGGTLELFSRFSIFGYRMDNDCTDCHRCRSICPTGSRPAEKGCTNCGDCTGVCPTGRISVKLKG
jgi:ferredoxin-type protein NapH